MPFCQVIKGVAVILKVAVFRKINKKRIFFIKPRSYVKKDCYATSFGEIEIYTVYHSICEKKAKKLFFKNFGTNFHTADEEPSENYLIKLCHKKIINDLKAKKAQTVFVDFEIPFEEIEKVCQYSKVLYLNSNLFYKYSLKLFENCGVYPCLFKPGIVCDRVLNEKEKPTANLNEEVAKICPKEFSPTLFCSLIYQENGIFTG